MISIELLNNLRTLSRGEKLHILQVLVSELAQEEAQLLRPGGTYPIWSPYDEYEAAEALLPMLKASESEDHAQR
jgi:hypothetical protein